MPYKQVSLRIPKTTIERLKVLAKDQHRTLSQQVQHYLECQLILEGEKAAPPSQTAAVK